MMKKFTFIISLIALVTINLIFIQNGTAQCNMPFNKADSLRIVELNRIHSWDVSYDLVDTLGECYVESLGFIWSVFDESTTPIGDFPFLRNLNFGYCNFFNLASIDYSGLPSLEVLDFYEITTDDTSFPDFNIPTLKSLSMTLVNLSGPVTDFSNIPNLQTLFLTLEDIDDPIPDFSNLPNLESLTIGGSSAPDFSNLPQLKHLSIGGSQIEYPDFSNLPLLKELNLSHSNFMGTIHNFSKVPLVEKLGFGVLKV